MSTRGIQPEALRRLWSVSILLGPHTTPAWQLGCNFSGPSATTGSARSQMLVGKVPDPSGTELQPFGADLLRDQGRSPCLWASGPALLLDCGGLLAVRRDRWRVTVWISPWCRGSVANWSVLHPTRLETRTKESNMCASHGVVRNLKA